MIKRNILNTTVLCAVLLGCKTVDVNYSIYKRAKQIIENTDAVLDYTKNELKADEVKIFVSDEKIPFNNTSLETVIIKTDYIKGFNVFENQSISEEAIIKKVNDSLYKRDLALNKDFTANVLNDTSAKSDMNKYNYILYFSNFSDGQLFAQLVPYNYEINKDISFKEVAFGTGFSFLFNIEKDRIVKTYHDKVHFN